MKFTTYLPHNNDELEAEVYTEIIKDSSPNDYEIKVILYSSTAGDRYAEAAFDIRFTDIKHIYAPVTEITSENETLYNTVINMLVDKFGDLWGWTAN